MGTGKMWVDEAIDAWTSSDDRLQWTVAQATFNVDESIDFSAWPSGMVTTGTRAAGLKPCTSSGTSYCLTTTHLPVVKTVVMNGLTMPKTWDGAGSHYHIFGVPASSAFNVNNAYLHLDFMTGSPSEITTDIYFPNIQRCDRGLTGGPQRYGVQGYVMPEWDPTWYINAMRQGLFDYAWHIYPAQLSGLPGWEGSNPAVPLHRTTSTAIQGANRNVSCPATGYPRPTPTGYSCDEYPMASTDEGARSFSRNPGLPARTIKTKTATHVIDGQMKKDVAYDYTLGGGFDPGYSRCYIPASENSSAGGPRQAFNEYYRVLGELPGKAQGDGFYIGYVNT